MSQKKSIDYCHQLAEAKGGKCLTTEYKNSHIKYLWECKEGHRWEAAAGNIRQGQWCPTCAQKAPHALGWLRELAAQRGGRCLATEYKTALTKYLWECKEGHRWEAKANNIQQGQWCAHCAQRVPHNLQWLQELAAEKEGRCLATEYKNNATKCLWECKEGHRWEAQATSIQQNHWCPHCARKVSKPEVQLLEFIQQFYPDAQKGKSILKNKQFELDIYVPSLRKAIEFDGEFWHYSDWAVARGSKQRDQRKNQQCAEAGIQLLRVREKEWLEDCEKTKKEILEFLGENLISKAI